MGRKLYVGNLAYQTTEGDLKALFSQAGTVTSCDLILDRFTSKSRGFAFVEMGTDEEAKKAIAEFNGKDMDGRALTVNEAKPREERGGGGGGGGRGGHGGGHGGGRREFSGNRY
ncbi:MAG: RNA recognition motif [Verrucomicrobia bacterium ADurb.Bin345]|nr:MAG: RNA recognition motif [Verrucomicrobia bacterium ADurb.Bin345]